MNKPTLRTLEGQANPRKPIWPAVAATLAFAAIIAGIAVAYVGDGHSMTELPKLFN